MLNALIQPHFDYACPAWYPNLNEKTKKKIQIMQNKCIRFCLKLDKMHHISENEFRLINWLPTSKRVDQCINTITYNFVNNTCPYYLNEIFEFAAHCTIGTRTNFSKLENTFRKTNMGQKTISYIGPSIWNSLPDTIKWTNSLNTFKHHAKKHYLTWIIHIVYMRICVSIYICLYVRGWVHIYIWTHISVFSFDLSIRMIFSLVCFVLWFSFWLEGPQ